MKLILVISVQFFAFFSQIVYSQSLKGTITGSDRQPVSYATIYISELRTGTATNIDGKYEIKLPSGTYNIEIRALGFTTQKKPITIKDKTLELNIVLLDQPYSIADVIIKKGSEDPANPIMRKAIALAPFYLNQVKHYLANVYIKGSLHVIKIPKIVESMSAAQGTPVKSGDVFFEESVDEINYNSPDKYLQRVISVKSNFPENNQAQPLEFMTASFYQPNFYNSISPLSPKAFSYYKFRYEGFFYENENTVFKIRVIPRYNNPKLFSGIILLLDKTYNLHSLDLAITFPYGYCQLRQQYTNIKENAWMPVSNSLYYNLKWIGAKAELYYVSSVKYANCEINTGQKVPAWLKQKKTDEKVPEMEMKEVKMTKQQVKIEKLMQKESLTTGEMIRLARLMKKEIEKDTAHSNKSLEEKSDITFKIDSDARKKDTIYWKLARPIPLMKIEQKSINKFDSLEEVRKRDSITEANLFGSNKYAMLPGIIMFGHNWQNSFSYGYFSGLVNPSNIWYNPVDGFGYCIEASRLKALDSAYWLKLNAKVGYSFGRKVPYWNIGAGLLYAPELRGNFYVDAGHWSSDYSGQSGIDKTINTLSCLFFKKNYSKLYDSRYFDISNRIDISNGLEFFSKFSFDDRKELINLSDYSFFYRKTKSYSVNIPMNSFYIIEPWNKYTAVSIEGNVDFTPQMRYRKEKGRKINLWSHYPTFSVAYKQGIKGFLNSDANYSFGSAMIRQNIKWGLESSLTYEFSAGKFFRKNSLNFADFYHPFVNECPVAVHDLTSSFALLNYYKLSTPDRYAEAHISYSCAYLILKYLPIINLTDWNESISGSAITVPGSKPYYEIGYGLKKFLLGSSLYFFVDFNGQKYSTTGFKLELPIFSNKIEIGL